MNKKILMIAGAAIALGVAGAAYWYFSGKQAPQGFRLGKIERGNLVAAVSATGTLNPVVSVQVGSQVSGQIKEIFVDYNSAVKKGDVIARIDPESFALRVNQAAADLEAGRATALTQRANVAALQAEVSRAEVALAETERDLRRNQMLVEKGFVSQAVLEKSQSAVATAREQVKTAQAQRAVGDAQVRNGEALVRQRESQLAQAKVDLERTTIRAPVDGIVISRSVDAGQTVAASLQAPTLFLIARNLTDMQVEASIDESEIGRIAIGHLYRGLVPGPHLPRKNHPGAQGRAGGAERRDLRGDHFRTQSRFDIVAGHDHQCAHYRSQSRQCAEAAQCRAALPAAGRGDSGEGRKGRSAEERRRGGRRRRRTGPGHARAADPGTGSERRTTGQAGSHAARDRGQDCRGQRR